MHFDQAQHGGLQPVLRAHEGLDAGFGVRELALQNLDAIAALDDRRADLSKLTHRLVRARGRRVCIVFEPDALHLDGLVERTVLRPRLADDGLRSVDDVTQVTESTSARAENPAPLHPPAPVGIDVELLVRLRETALERGELLARHPARGLPIGVGHHGTGRRRFRLAVGLRDHLALRARGRVVERL